VGSTNVECVKRLALGPGEHPDRLRVAHEDTVIALEDTPDPAATTQDDSLREDATQAALDCLHPDVVIHIPPSMPYGGDHIGHEGFLRMGAAMTSTWRVTDGLDMWFVDIGDDQVVCFVAFLGESRHTGRTVPMRMVERYRLVDGRIAEIELFYWDTAAIAEATGGVKTIA
jgi:ketosteroid isomerase-like protein